MRSLAHLPLLLAACATQPQVSQKGGNDVERFMWGYTETWNKHDAAGLAQNYYRLGGRGVAEQTVATKKTFEDLVAQGYDKSTIHEVKGCPTGADTAWAAMKFTRLKTDGQPLGPRDRASAYELTKFADGWRIVGMIGGTDVTKPLECPKT